MNIGQAIIEALESLISNKLRAGLTILGIVIGVAAVIAMLAVGAGAQNSISDSINGIGTNLLFVTSGSLQRTQNTTVQRVEPLTQLDAQAIADPLQAPDVAAVAPIIQGGLDVSYNGEQETVQVTGVTPDFATVRNVTLAEGDFISGDQEMGGATVAVIGPTTADNLFGSHVGVVGNTIRIAGQPFRVIGVLTSRGGSSFGNQDDLVYVPLNTAQMRLIHRPNYRVDMIYLSAASSDVVNAASDEVAEILRERHHDKVGQDDFTILSQQDILSTAQSITGVLTVFLGGIAAISLLVGGIGIMNIMLVSVTERTREIGLRKAIGARKRDILVQFLTESALLSLFGGIIGIALGWLIGFIVGKVAVSLGTALIPVVSLQAILLATLFSTAVGLFFGIYPANRAANLQPVDALRYE
ncbi:MAG: ABC transporter permease [Anaerolineaceae bacterium]|jgi:putative ABC transport system permease protein